MGNREPWYAFVHWALRPILAIWFRWRYEGLEHIPRGGPVIVASNHVSYFDPLSLALMLVRNGRRPRFLAKRELFVKGIVGRAMRGAHQIPVDRGSGSGDALDAARRALAAGECVVIYPEATLTRNPDYSPMAGKTGVARLATSTGAPVLPVAIWGPQRVIGRRGEPRSFRPGRPIWLKVGPPVDLSDLAEPVSRGEAAAMRRGTERVMGAIGEMVADLRSRYPSAWLGR